jgi:hypothetical protein
MDRLVPTFTGFSTSWFREVTDAFLSRTLLPHFSPLHCLHSSFSPSPLYPRLVRGPSPTRKRNKSKVRQLQVEPHLDLSSDAFVTELSLSLDAGMTPKKVSKALDDLRGQVGLTKMELRAPHLELDAWEQTVAVHSLSGAVIYMSLLSQLSLPEILVTETLILHISLLPQLEKLIVFPAPSENVFSGVESNGFASLRSLDIPNECLLRRFLSYSLQNLEALRVGNLGRKSLPGIARNLIGLRQLSIEGPSFSFPEILPLGACFCLEEINILTRYPLGMDGLDLHRFRAMFPNLRSLSIATREA